jgi:hypothetical protein
MKLDNHGDPGGGHVVRAYFPKMDIVVLNDSSSENDWIRRNLGHESLGAAQPGQHWFMGVDPDCE